MRLRTCSGNSFRHLLLSMFPTQTTNDGEMDGNIPSSSQRRSHLEDFEDTKLDRVHVQINMGGPVLTRSDLQKIEQSIIRKVDLRMLPLLGVLSAMSLIDRTNIGLARTAGMDHDLKLYLGSRYNIVVCIYFVPYILLQLPSNLFLRKLGGVYYLSFLVMAWGGVQLSMGFVPSWGYLAFVRALLGVFEAGFFPAMIYIITTWYTRHEVQTRLGIFYLTGVLSGGFSAIFAYLLTLLGGKGGLPGWSWIFIVEGIITIFFGIVAWFFLPGFPDQNRFLTPEETAIVLERVENDRGDSLPDPVTKEKIITHLLDWNIWSIGVMYMCATMPAYAISFVVSFILRGMGWSIAASLLLAAPPYIVAAFSILFFSWLSDKYRQRAVFIAIQAVITLIGIVVTGYASTTGGRYTGVFLTVSGSGGCIPSILAYSSNNIVSHSKHAVSTAITIAFAGIGGIFGSLIFRQVDAPRYLPGIYAVIACQLLILVLLGLMTVSYRRKNRAVRDGTAAHPSEGKIGFLYTL